MRRWMDWEARDKKEAGLRRKKEGAKRTVARTGLHNVILTEITPPRLPRDNKFATLSRILE